MEQLAQRLEPIVEADRVYACQRDAMRLDLQVVALGLHGELSRDRGYRSISLDP